ncbi:MAG: lysine--tRNA ligase [Eubacteriales bacterium]
MADNKETPVQVEETQENLSQLLQVRRDKLKELQESGHDPFHLTKAEITHYSASIKENFDALEGSSVKLAGRLMSKRGMGKVLFCDLQDQEGRIQLYLRKDDIEAESFARFKKVDIGDIVAVEGSVFRTQKGEMSIHCTAVTLLSKSLLPLPEKFHGLTNQEQRYRQRYVDLIVNPEVRRTFQIRSQFIRHMRKYLDERGYMEVETPVLNTISGGATARPFTTHHNTLDLQMYMRIATELHLKRLVVGGLDRVYEIGRIFRNEGMDSKHNPEFTSIELYEAYTDYMGMMEIAQGVISSAAQEILGTYEVTWQGHNVNLAPDQFRCLTMAEAVKEETGIDFMSFEDDATALAEAKKIGVELAETADPTWGNALYAIFDQRVEGKLIQPTFITMYPVEVSPLSKKCPTDGRLTERFELFICASELANAFSELNDPIDQKERFQKQVDLRDKGDEEAGMMDEDYINALEYGLPPTGGMGIGIDRCVMMLTGQDTIREVIFFPTMRPE